MRKVLAFGTRGPHADELIHPLCERQLLNQRDLGNFSCKHAHDKVEPHLVPLPGKAFNAWSAYALRAS